MSIAAGHARRRMLRRVEEVDADQTAVEITSPRGAAYLVAADDYRSLREAVYLLRSPTNARRLRESLDQVRGRAACAHDSRD